MSELLDIIISAVDEASETFESIVGSAEDAQSSLEGMSESAETVPSDAIQETADAVDQVEQEANESATALDNINNIITGMAGAEVFGTMADALMDLADKAGTYQDSMMRASLEAEGAGISVNDMTDTISKLSSETGRAGGQIREAFINATARGITNMDSFKTMMEGAGAQATLFNTDIETMGNKFSQMAMRSTLMERGLASTGITMAELADAMGMSGATADEVKEKWKELDTNQRAAILGQAASMNEGEQANEAYKNSWAGLHEQIEIAKGRIERLAGQVLLPVLIPAMQAAANVLNWLGGVMDSVMSGPLSGLVSAIGAVAAGIALAVPAIAAIQAGMSLFAASIWPAITASWALLAPWLPWIALGAAIVLIIYEIGKAFGWWSDASSMIESISAGLQRLWEAFINNPDVQAFIQALSDGFNVLMEIVGQVGQAILDFFGINTSGEFDIVRALIDAVGMAWNNLKTILQPVITLVMGVINAFNQFRTGQIDLPTFIWNVMTLLFQAYQTVFGMVVSFVVSVGARLVATIRSAASRMVNGMISYLRQLPGRAYTALIGVVSRIVSAGASWLSNARSQANSVVNGVYNTFTGLPGKISSALSGVVNAITSPFKSAYDSVCGIVDNIKSKVEEGMNALGNLNGAAGFEAAGFEAAGFEAAGFETSTNTNETIDVNYNISLDLNNVPGGMSSTDLINALTNRDVLTALTGNRDFQTLDAKVKARINAKSNRARGA